MDEELAEQLAAIDKRQAMAECLEDHLIPALEHLLHALHGGKPADIKQYQEYVDMALDEFEQARGSRRKPSSKGRK
jgi:hypothetical protein